MGVIAEWPGKILIWRLRPGVYGALGADGDIIEALTGLDRPRWPVMASDGTRYRAYPLAESEILSLVVPTLSDAELDVVRIEEITENRNE